MYNETIVSWHSCYSVGIKAIDEQHMELIKLTNKLFLSCLIDEERSRKTFLDTIHEVVDYVGYHFGTEEKIMERVHYPEAALHKSEHVEFIRVVLSKVQDYTDGKVRTPLAFVYYLRDWVLNHIAYSDKKLGRYLVALKRNGAMQNFAPNAKKAQASEKTFTCPA